MRISYSGLETFNTCPLKYKFQYIDRISVPKIKEAIFGTIVHECLRQFHNPSNSLPMAEEELLKCFTDKWDSSFYENEQEEGFAFAQGIDLLKRYYLENHNKNLNIVSLETSIEIPLKDGQEFHQITGKVDRIDKLDDGTFEVIDYKTTKKMPAQKFIDENMQLDIYHLGILHRWPSLKQAKKPVKLTLYFLKHGEALSTIKKIHGTKETEDKILETIKKIQKSNFDPQPNALCDWCSYQSHCPMYKHKFIAEKTIDDKEAEKITEEYLAIKGQHDQDRKRLGEIKTQLGHYFDQKKLDRIFGSSGQITRLSQQRFSYDMKIVKEVLSPLGKWNEILTINKVKFKKTIKALPYDSQKKIEQAKTLEKEFKIMTVSKKKS